MGVKAVVQQRVPDGVNQFGLTLSGFLFLHSLFIEKGQLETAWAVLRKFGYDNDLKLRDDYLPVLSKRAPDQVTNRSSAYIYIELLITDYRFKLFSKNIIDFSKPSKYCMSQEGDYMCVFG